MKKLLVALAIAATIGTAAFAGESGVYLNGGVSINAGVDGSNWFRGYSASGRVYLDLIGLTAGIEVKADMDTAWGNFASFPVLLTVGLGRDFWVMAGQTIYTGDPTLVANGVTTSFDKNLFPNTIGLGFNIFSIDLGFLRILPYVEALYVAPVSILSASFDAKDILAGLKIYLGGSVELKLL
jgi:hypothetical protein